MKGEIKVYIYEHDLDEFLDNPYNVKFFTSKPQDVKSSTLLEIGLDLNDYNKLRHHRSNGRKLLKG